MRRGALWLNIIPAYLLGIGIFLCTLFLFLVCRGARGVRLRRISCDALNGKAEKAAGDAV